MPIKNKRSQPMRLITADGNKSLSKYGMKVKKETRKKAKTHGVLMKTMLGQNTSGSEPSWVKAVLVKFILLRN